MTTHPPPSGVEISVDPEGEDIWLVPVVRGWSSRDDTEAEAYLVASNKLTQLGGWDQEGLLEMLEEIEHNAGLEGIGYTPDDLAELRRLLDRDSKTPLTEVDAVPKKPKKAVSKLGDVYLLGEHRLVCGDARDGGTARAALDGKTIDICFTDPPYGVTYEGKTEDKLTIDNDELTGVELSDLLDDVFQTTIANCRPGAVFYVCGPAGPNSHIFGAVLGRMGIWRQTIVWVKDRFVMGRGDFHYRHELLFAGESPSEEEAPDEGVEDIRFGWIPGAAHRRPTNRRNDTVWEFPRPSASRLHPTMKPVDLITHALECSSAPREVVYDPFAGSGSTLIAAWGSDRVFAGAEIDPVYVDVICRRFEEHTGIMPILEGFGERSFLQATDG